MLLGIVYLLLGIGLIVVSVGVGNGFVFLLGLALALVGSAFLSQARAERQALEDYRNYMSIINNRL